MKTLEKHRRSINHSVRRFFYLLTIIALFAIVSLSMWQQSAKLQAVDALLGVRDVPVSSEQWSSLDGAAGAILENIASDSNELPTRRARALEGVVALRTDRFYELLVSFAHTEDESLVLRMSAIRGLGRVLPPSSLISELSPILQTARESQLRGVAAEILARDPAGCAEVEKQAQHETAAWRNRFFKTGICVAGSNSSDSAASPKIISPDSLFVEPRVASPATGTNFAAAAGETQVIDLGTVDVFTDRLSAPLTVTLPTNAVSVEFASVAVSDTTSRVVVYRIDSPDGRLYDYSNINNQAKILPSVGPGSFSVLLPNTPTLPFHPGNWTIKLLGAKQTTAAVKAIIKTAPVDALGTINLNLFFVGLANLNANSAPTDQRFRSIIDDVRHIYAQQNITIGSLRYIDITGADATTYRDLQDSDLGALMKLSNNSLAQQNAANIFFVHTIIGGGIGGGFIILGESAGIPGNPFLGTTGSGLAVTTADFPNGLSDIGLTWAHEMGHWLGLFHTTESRGTDFDPLPDTPECGSARDINGDGLVDPAECVGYGADNIMFWTNFSSMRPSVLTPHQQYVMLRNPVVVTAAPATVDGRVLTSDGRGLRNATVSITDSNNVIRRATTSSFGFFSFDNVGIGGTYTLRISSRLYRYSPQTVQVNDNLTLPDFVGLE